MPLKKFSVDPDWTSILQGHLPYTIDLSEQEIQCQLLFSLLLHLNLSLRDLLPEGPEVGPEFDRMKEAREISQTLIAQLTEVIGSLHRLNAVIDQRKGSSLGEAPPKPKKVN